MIFYVKQLFSLLALLSQVTLGKKVTNICKVGGKCRKAENEILSVAQKEHP